MHVRVHGLLFLHAKSSLLGVFEYFGTVKCYGTICKDV